MAKKTLSDLEQLERDLQPPKTDSLLKRIGASFGSQWSGHDDKGRARSMIYSDWDAPRDKWQYNGEAGMDLPPQRFTTPGISLDMMSLPHDFGLAGDDSFSADSGRQLDDISAQLHEQHGVGPADTLPEHAAEILGTMLGQIPVPGQSAKRPAVGALQLLREALSKPGRAMLGAAKGAGKGILELFSPTAEMGAAGYLAPTAMGTALEALRDHLSDPELSDEEREELLMEIQRLLAEEHAHAQ